MENKDGFIPANCTCTHCGNYLEMRPLRNDGSRIEIKGFEAMEYRHAHDGRKICVSFGEARPYTDAGKREKYYEALEALSNEE